MVLFGTSLYGCGSLCVLSGDDSGLPEPGRPDTPRTHIASTKAWSWLKGLRQAVVDRDKGGELASLAGDTLQEAIEAARRGIRRVRRTPHLPGVLRGELVLGWEPTWHLSELRCPPSVQAKPGQGDGPSGPPLPHLDVSAPRPPSSSHSSIGSSDTPQQRSCGKPAAWRVRSSTATSSNADATLPARPATLVWGCTASSQSSFVHVLGCDGPPAT